VKRKLDIYRGHSSIQITLDRYGHLIPGNEDEAVVPKLIARFGSTMLVSA
jgi:hypothetical protein